MGAVGFQSDSHQLLVDTLLARLRTDARLDEDPVLPTIDVLPDDEDEFAEVGTGEIIIECAEVKDLPSATSIVRESARANSRERQITTERKRRLTNAAVVRHARWPVVLCALVATYFAIGSFLRSPLGAKPEVQEVVKVSRAQITAAIDTTVKTTKSLVRR